MERPASPTSWSSVSAPITETVDLPPLVAAMRSRILAACRTGDIEALRVPIDRNEVRPLFEKGARDPGADPVANLKRLSFDGTGREMLLILQAVLRQACVRVERGLGPMRTRLYVWPAFALIPPPAPTPDEQQLMLSCLRFADLARDPPPIMRVGIGVDGVWHFFWNEAA